MARAKKHNVFAKFFVICFALAAAFSLITTQLQVSNLKRDMDSLSKSIADQKQKNNELERLLSMDENDEYIEEIARDKLGFCYPDEKIIIDRSGN